MDREEILKIAGEIGINEETANGYPSDYHIVAFANAIAAHEREAMIAEAAKMGWGIRNDDPFEDSVAEIAAIRSRGNKHGN